MPRPSRRELPPYKLGLEVIRKYGPIRPVDIANEIGLTPCHIYAYIRLWKEDGLVYTHSWGRQSGSGPMYQLIALRTNKRQYNAKKPPRKTGAERAREYRKKKRAIVQAKKRLERGATGTNPFAFMADQVTQRYYPDEHYEEELLSLRATGMGQQALARELKISTVRVKRILEKHGLNRRGKYVR